LESVCVSHHVMNKAGVLTGIFFAVATAAWMLIY
jgi:hypothetical protein